MNNPMELFALMLMTQATGGQRIDYRIRDRDTGQSKNSIDHQVVIRMYNSNSNREQQQHMFVVVAKTAKESIIQAAGACSLKPIFAPKSFRRIKGR